MKLPTPPTLVITIPFNLAKFFNLALTIVKDRTEYVYPVTLLLF